DFGEYQESYYSVQTTEGEQISQLIAGYIDIILKKKQSKDRFGLEGDEESTMLEESVSPKKSTILQQQFNRVGRVEHGCVALPAVMRSGLGGPETFNMDSMPPAQQHVMTGQMHRGHMPPLSSAQQALMGTINTSIQAVQQAQTDLGEVGDLPPLGQDMASRVWVQNKVDESKHEIHSQVDAITAGTASVVNLTAGDPADTDYTAVGCAITTISSNLTEMSKGVKLLAAFMDDDVGSGQDLMKAARTLAGAVSDLLKAVEPASGENAAKQAAAAATQTIAASQNAAASNKNTAAHQQLVQSCKAVADYIPQLVQGVRGSQAQPEDLSAQLTLIIASQNFLQPGSKMVTSAKSAVPTVTDQAAAMQLGQCAKNLATSLAELRSAAQQAHEACGPMEIDSALTAVQTLKNELQDAKMAAAEGQLKPLPGESLEKCAQDLGSTSKAVGSSMAQLLTCAAQGNEHYTGKDQFYLIQVTVKGMLDNPNEPVSDLSYFDCIESVMENSKVLGESMAGISHNCKTGDLPAFGDCVSVASKALCGLTEAAGQASYLVGVSDPNSQAGQQGLVDPIQFARANQAIQMACQNLVDPASSPSQVLSAATIVAKHTSALCNACRIASSKTGNPVAKRHFVQSAKEVANSTANLVKTIKALDGDFSEENRDKCRVATSPLIEAVENLAAFASNPEFVSIPAQISREGCAAQEPILYSARAMLDSSSLLLKTARSLVINPKDPPTWSILAGHSRTVSDSIKSLITSIRDKAPGQRECDYSIDNINRCIRGIEQASLAAVSQNLPSRDDISLEALQEQLTSVVQEIGHVIDPISYAARGEAAQLGHKVTQLASYFEPLILASVGVASKLLDHQQQMTVLDQTKTLAESALQMLYAAKEGGGNPKAAHTHDAIAEAAQLMKEAVDDIMVTMNEAASEVGMVGGMVDSIAEAMGRLDEGTPPEPEGSFVDYQTTMVKYSKAIAVTAQEMIGFQIKTRVQELGHGCIFLVQKAGALQVTPTDSFTKRELIECARAVTEKVSMVLSALQAGNKGTQACITAASAVSGIIADLDTTIMFASSGTLNAENEESFADHRENILKTAKALVEDTKMLVSGAASSQDKLAQAAQSSANTITQLTDVVKLGATSIGSDDPETQQADENLDFEEQILEAAKSIAAATSALVKSASAAQTQETMILVVAVQTLGLLVLWFQADENLDFEEQILEAAKSIAAATSALVKSASAAQRELVAQGKVGSIPANAVDDGQWSQGLISAARMVAAATSNLCEAANASVQGHASEEKLISSAKQVAASTAQLLVACKVKADQDSEAMRRLQAAGNAVKRASDNLVRAAQKAAFDKNDAADVVVKTKFVGGIAQIIAAQEEMLRKERELEEARKKLAQIRQQQYKFLPTELREDEN
ncbi:UNVERIFIED_CONTAM: hypothetical protein FKN15_076359, partial [Acipenser sinensis]